MTATSWARNMATSTANFRMRSGLDRPWRLELTLNRSAARAKGREPYADMNSLRLQVLLVGEDVEVGELRLGVLI